MMNCKQENCKQENKHSFPISFRVLSVLLMAVLVFSGATAYGLTLKQDPDSKPKLATLAEATDPPPSVGKVKNLTALRSGADSLSLKWDRSAGAKGYTVYRYDGSKKKYSLLTTKKGAKNTTHLDKHLSPGKVYRYKVRGWNLVKGKKKFGKASLRVTARPYPAGAKAVNAGKIVFEEKILNLGFVDGVKAGAYVRPETISKAKGKKPVAKTVRWYASNGSVATVSRDGRITTKRKTGVCYVYAVAHNGV